VIESPDGPITDQAEIQAHLTKEWETKFQHPAGSLPHVLGLEAATTPTALLPSARKWEEFLQNPEAMRDFLLADDNVHVPPAMIDIIVDAFSNNPGRGTAEEELALALAEPFSVYEMLQIIKKKTNMAPGLSGLTYQMLSLLPAEASRDMFCLMERMWNAKHVPEFLEAEGADWAT
jgi:hypothetical protein